MNSVESSRRFHSWDDGLRANPATYGREFRNGEVEKYPLGKKGKSLGLPKMFRSKGKTSEYKEENGGSRTRSDSEEEEKALAELQGLGIRRYEYMELHAATQGFSDTRKIGWAPFGAVYKGMLHGQQAVAIRRVPRTMNPSFDVYLNEAKVLSQLRHRNVVQLLGYGYEAGQFAFVFEFMPNGSLADHMFGKQDLPPLPWKVRYSRITLGLASALFYLHEGVERCVVHRDIALGRVLLDSDFNQKLAGFGLALVGESGVPEPEFPSTFITGMPGYLDPYYAATQKLTKASDIYSFGVLALQIASGRDAVGFTEESKHLPKWVGELREKGRILEAVDPKLGDDFDKQEVERLLLVGLSCTQFDPKSRPSIKLIIQLLKFEAPMPSFFTSSVRGNVENGVERAWMSDSSPSMSMESILADCLDDATNYKHVFHPFTSFDMVQPVAPGEDSGATTTSTEKIINMGEIEDDGDDDRLPVLVQDVGKYKLLSEQTQFNIGIPPDLGSAEITNRRKEHQRHILKGFVGSLHEMMQSKENLPTFDEALEKIRMYTTSLVQAVGPPLDDWNTLAQLVLRTLKERDDFFEFCTNRTLPIENITLLSLNADMRECASTIDEDRGKLKDCKELLAQALEKCASLDIELAKAQEISLSIAEQIKAVEQRITENLSSLEREGHCALSQQYEHVLSAFSAFNC